MKKLYVNIEKVRITGGPQALYSVINNTDMALQNMTEKTANMVTFLSKYSESNKGIQFDKLINSTMQLRDDLCDASVEINDMLVQIVKFVNKLNQYEDSNETLPLPNNYVMTRKGVSSDVGTFQFGYDEMIEVERECREYREEIYQSIKGVNTKKNSMASIWMDPQYDDYSDFIQDITRKIVDALKVYDEYLQHLNSKIKDMR